MPLTTRMILILALILSIASGLSGQETATAAETEETATATATATASETAADAATETAEGQVVPTSKDQQVREAFAKVLAQHQPELTTVLALSPSLLTNDQFLARYPNLADFVKANPEVGRNPYYFVREYELPAPRQVSSPLDHAIHTLTILAVFIFIAFVLAWAVRVVIEQKRWNRLSRSQAEVHNRILDRFSTSEELLAYVRSAAGTRFLESAPIPLHAERSRANPASLAMWSIQIGIIVAAGALGMILVSLRFTGESAQGLFALGVIGFCIGGGFVGSAAVSLMLSKRLGVWDRPNGTAENVDESGPVR